MITQVFTIILSTFVLLISTIFSALNFIVPSAIPNAFATFFNYVHLGDGVFPFSQALLAIFTVLGVWVLLYVVKIFLFGFSLIPWIGKVVNLPHHGSVTESTSESFNAKGQSMGTRKTRSERR